MEDLLSFNLFYRGDLKSNGSIEYKHANRFAMHPHPENISAILGRSPF